MRDMSKIPRLVTLKTGSAPRVWCVVCGKLIGHVGTFSTAVRETHVSRLEGSLIDPIDPSETHMHRLQLYDVMRIMYFGLVSEVRDESCSSHLLANAALNS